MVQRHRGGEKKECRANEYARAMHNLDVVPLGEDDETQAVERDVSVKLVDLGGRQRVEEVSTNEDE